MFALPALFYGIGAIVLFASGKWSFLRIPPMGSLFEDLQSLTATVNCANVIERWDLKSESCDPFDRPFNYPTIWVSIFQKLHLGFERTNLIGFVFAFLIFLCLIFWGYFAQLNVKKLGDVAILTLLSVSSPMFLLVERANIDILIFFGLTMASLLLIKFGSKSAVILISTLAFLKIYPLGGFMLFLSKRTNNKTIYICSLTLVILFAVHFQDLLLIRDRTPFTVNYSFGIGVIPQHFSNFFGLEFSRNQSTFIGMVLSVFATILLLTLCQKSIYHQNNLSNFWIDLSKKEHSRDIFLIFSGIYITCFSLGTNFDYRLVFLIPLATTIIRMESKAPLSKLLLIMITVGILTSLLPGLFAVFSDLFLELIAILICVLLLKFALSEKMTLKSFRP